MSAVPVARDSTVVKLGLDSLLVGDAVFLVLTRLGLLSLALTLWWSRVVIVLLLLNRLVVHSKVNLLWVDLVGLILVIWFVVGLLFILVDLWSLLFLGERFLVLSQRDRLHALLISRLTDLNFWSILDSLAFSVTKSLQRNHASTTSVLFGEVV